MADPLAGCPEKPQWLTGEAEAEWGRLVPLLLERRILSRLDGPALSLLVMCWAEWRRAVGLLEESGPSVKTSAGGTKPSPALQGVDGACRRLLMLLKEFGLTPASRSGVTPIVGVADEVRTLDEFLGARPAVAGRLGG